MTQNLKKCRNCGAIQEHSLQQTCPKCGTKNAFTEEKVKVKEKTIKKCKNCGTIQEHSLQSICPNWVKILFVQNVYLFSVKKMFHKKWLRKKILLQLQ